MRPMIAYLSLCGQRPRVIRACGQRQTQFDFRQSLLLEELLDRELRCDGDLAIGILRSYNVRLKVAAVDEKRRR